MAEWRESEPEQAVKQRHDRQEQSIRLLLVEDDPDWRRGLAAYLAKEPDLVVAAEAESAEQALAAIADVPVDVVLMDIMLASGMEGLWLTSEVCAHSRAKVLMLSSLTERETVFGAFQAGATDYLIKSNFEEIPAAVRAAHRDRAPISASVAEQMRQEFRRLKAVERQFERKRIQDQITPAELQVLELIDRGYSQPQIAEKHFISLRTVKVHVGNVLRKLGGGSSRDAARKVKELGLFEKDDS